MALNELSELEVRFSERLDELKWLYYELYYGDEQGFQYLCSLIQDFYENRSESLKALDRKAAGECAPAQGLVFWEVRYDD